MHLLDVDDLDPGELEAVLDAARQPPPWPQVLAGRGAGLLFEKASNRTRNATELAVAQLGGHPVVMQGDDVGLGTRETVEDVTRVLAGYHALIGARVFDHGMLERMAAVSAVPVVNLLSDRAHPLQAVADLLTLGRHLGPLAGRSLAYVGDGNNVCTSLMVAAAMAGMELRVATPEAYRPAPEAVDRALTAGSGTVTVTGDPRRAVAGADAVYTDVWTSMGQEAEAADRSRAFDGWTVDEALMSRASKGALFLHCLPAHRGHEVSAAVIDGPSSVVWEQAADRLHACRGLLLRLFDPARAAA